MLVEELERHLVVGVGHEVGVADPPAQVLVVVDLAVTN